MVLSVGHFETDSSYVGVEGSYVHLESGVAVADKEGVLVLPQGVVVVSVSETLIATLSYLRSYHSCLLNKINNVRVKIIVTEVKDG